jgi:FKBP-type peptidyl-prolyl cis-trans isomerase
MTRRFILPLFAVVLTLAACETEPDTSNLDTLDDQVAYIVGHDLGSALHDQMEQLDAQDVELDRDLIIAAVRDGLSGDSMRFSQTELDSLMRAFQDTLVARQSLANLRESETFLAETAALDSVQATDSGLLYKIIETGEGRSPELGDTVVVNYRGTLPDSTEFDSSFNRGRPARFVVGEVIPGWNEALQLMKPGAQYELYIPADLAYGEQAPPQIGPNRALIFQVELLDVMPGAGAE